MALPWDPSGNYVPGTGVLTNPVQNPVDPQNQEATLAAAARDREARAKFERMMMKALAVKEEPLNAQGPGPFGARMGVGPMGWATTIGDVVAGVIAQKRREKAQEEERAAQSGVAPAASDYFSQYMKGRQGGLYGADNGTSYVPQGSPLSLGWDNLGNWKY